MTANSDINYGVSHTISLTNDSINNGGNYVGYSSDYSTTLGVITTGNITTTLDSGEYLSLWNETTYIWDIYIVGFYTPTVYVHEDDVLLIKVEDAETFICGGK